MMADSNRAKALQVATQFGHLYLSQVLRQLLKEPFLEPGKVEAVIRCKLVSFSRHMIRPYPCIRNRLCFSWQETVTVKVPAGVRTSMQIRRSSPKSINLYGILHKPGESRFDADFPWNRDENAEPDPSLTEQIQAQRDY